MKIAPDVVQSGLIDEYCYLCSTFEYIWLIADVQDSEIFIT